jgi:hypothetical protein
MKFRLKLFACALMMASHFSLSAAQRDDLWRQVNDAVQKGLPKTAITNLEPIIAGALKDKAYAEATKAIAKKSRSKETSKATNPRKKLSGWKRKWRALPRKWRRCSNPAGALVLAVLPAKSLAVHAAHGDGPGAGQGFHDLGFAAAFRGN